MPAPGPFAIDWRRTSRWCLLGTIAMFLWLMAPVVTCTYRAFRDTPLSELRPDVTPAGTDANRVEQTQGFAGKVVAASKVCYAETPLLGQDSWKTQLFLGLAAATVLAWLIHRVLMRRRKTFG